MKTAVDTSVLLDVFGNDPTFGAGSREALRRAYDAGRIVACEVVWAELRAHFETDEAFEAAVKALGLEHEPMEARVSGHAGSRWRLYQATRERRVRASGKGAVEAKRFIADFLIGAHAQEQCDALLARDRGFFRQYFRGLVLVQL